MVKALAVPLQVRCLEENDSCSRENPDAIYHAHTMYYLWVCWLAGIRYIGSPQGDEILIQATEPDRRSTGISPSSRCSLPIT